MAITLAEAKVGMADHVDQMVIDEFQRSSFLLDNLPFDNSISPGTGGSTLTYGYIQLKTPSTATTRAINAEYTANEAKREKKTTSAIIMGGSFKLDRVLQNTSGSIDELAFQARQKIKATANYFSYLCINGQTGSGGSGFENNTFDGLRKLLTGTSNEFKTTIDVSTAEMMDANYNALLDEVDAMVAAVDAPTMLLMNKGMLIKLRSAARRAGYYESSRDEFGRQVETYAGIPMIDLQKYYNGSASVDCVTDIAPGSGTLGTSQIYAVSTDMDGLHGITTMGNSIITSYMPDLTAPGAVKTGEVELVAGLALKNTLKAAVLSGIGTKPKTA